MSRVLLDILNLRNYVRENQDWFKVTTLSSFHVTENPVTLQEKEYGISEFH